MILNLTVRALKNGPSPASFSFHFHLFPTNVTFFTTNECEKMSIQYMGYDSNPRSSEHESPPISTRPGLPPVSVLWDLINDEIPNRWTLLLKWPFRLGTVRPDG